MTKHLKIWQKFLLFFILVLLIMFVWSVLVLLRTTSVNSAYQQILSNVELLNEANDLTNEAITELELYLTSNSFRSIESFNRKSDELYRVINSMPVEYSSPQEQIAYNNLRDLLITLNQQMDRSITDIRGRKPLQAMNSFDEVQGVAEQMHSIINYLVFKYMAASHSIYIYLSDETRNTASQSLLILTLLAILCMLSSFWFSKSITASLDMLSRHSQHVAFRPEEAHPIRIDGNDELAQLAQALNAMDDRIRSYIGELREKADIEKNLRETELKNLNMQNMLNAAELKALQSQINPHFLFNTLNSIAQLAMLEDADETYELIINLSGMLRYNLRRMDLPVALHEEIENLNRYFYIQKTRYGDAISFEVEINDPEMSNLMIPCLSLQPIIENSVIHGFEKRESKVLIRVACDSDADFYTILIEDNGIGMDQQTIDRIMYAKEDIQRGHSTGIGVHNVISRLSLFYGTDVFHISSALGVGTSVTLKIPRNAAH